MAETTSIECTSVEFAEGGETKSWTYCWENSVPDSQWKASDVTTGLRKSIGGGARAWRTCQYFLNGLPAVCGNFDGTTQKCQYKSTDQSGQTPSGYNNGKCDYLGRRSDCDKYTHKEDLGGDTSNIYVCILPNPYLSGVGKRVPGTEYPISAAVPISEITGYNADDAGVGKCDCYGMGRGAAGCAIAGTATTGSTTVEVALEKLPVVCSFYRPFSMGFGAIVPHMARRKDGAVDVYKLVEMAERGEPYEFRLPMNYTVYNLRARFQKCLWYENDVGSEFDTYDMAGGTFVVLDFDEAFDGDVVRYCKCPDTAAAPFKTRDRNNYPDNISANVWAKAGTVVCNGAKPECPCYTGKWYYCTDEKMWAGMPVTAQQIMELRFWCYEWDSQKEYDKFFSERPNPDDTARPEIYTFIKFARIADVESLTEMDGKKVSMCQPAPLNAREFIPKTYLKIESVKYVKFGTNTGSQATFPTLIRDPVFPYIKPLTVTYPYFSEDAFSQAVCTGAAAPNACSKKTNDVYTDFIHTVGCTLGNRSVYVLNTTAIGRVPRIVSENTNVLQLTPENKAELAKDLDLYISEAEKKFNNYIRAGTSNEKTGVFILEPVALNFGRNDLLIVVDFGGGDFAFRKREVKSLWCGGVASQTTYDYGTAAEAQSETKQPTLIDPPAELTASVLPLGGSESYSCFPARSYMVPSMLVGDKTYYSYSMYWEEKTDEEVKTACAVGNSTHIWTEIDNIDLSYLFDFEILKAKAIFTVKILKGGKYEEESIEVELEKVELDYRYIPPNACLFKPKVNTESSEKRYKFSPSSTKVFVSYKYTKFINGPIPSGKVGIHGGGMSETDIFKQASFSLSQGSGGLRITDIKDETLGVMFFFNDDKGRAISAVATKFMPYIIRPSCRNVEIRYTYKSEGKQYVLEPEHAIFCTDIAGNRLTGKIVSHISDPYCCDHMCSSAGKGPMWFPYNRCEQYDFYDVFTFANYCTAPIDVGPNNKGLICKDCGIAGSARRLDHRHRCPDKFQATAVVRGNWAAACNCGWKYYFSDASSASVQFTGYGNIKGIVDEKEYEANHWRMPPFGNDGRELIERYLSSDYIYYYDFQNPMIVHREWAPFVVDNTTFHLQFDAFTTNDITYDLDFSGALGFPGYDNFKHTNQLNFMTHDRTSEVIDYDNRKRFDEVFKRHIEGNCTYPPPILSASMTTAVSFYQFIDDSYLWAWQELWKKVERNTGGSTEEFNFISEYERPPYVWSLFKEEIKLICDEGDYNIEYEGPIMASESISAGGDAPPQGSEAEIETYPSISLNGENKKHFEIIYGEPDGNGIWHYSESDYGDQNIEWKKEGAEGKESGSSEEDNIYEDRFGDDWVFSQDARFENMLFDNSEEKDFYYRQDEFSGEYIKLKYCSGLMVRIPRSRLQYLPKELKSDTITITDIGTAAGEDFKFTVTSGAALDDQQKGTIGTTWYGLATFSGSAPNKPISKITIRGQYGRLFYDKEEEDLLGNTRIVNKEVVYVIPGVSVRGTTNDKDPNYTPRGMSPNSSTWVAPSQSRTKTNKMTNYELVFRFPLSPIEMIKKKFLSLIMMLYAPSWGFINVSELLIETAEYKTTAKEVVKVWERKYVTSTGNVEWKNVDGPEELLHYKKGGGVHFNYNNYPTEVIKTQNKIRGVFADVPFKGIGEDEGIVITYDNLFTMEAEEQQRLYKKALSLDPDASNIVYRSICPPPLNVFFTQVLRNVSFAGFGSCLFILSNAQWEKLKLVKDFLQTEYWRTGGHYYKWSDYFVFQSCMVGWHNSMASAIGGGPQGLYATDFERVFYGDFKHVEHAGIGTPVGGSEQSVDPGNSYYSLRFYYERARYERYENMTGQSPDGGFDLVSKANPYNVSR